MQLSFGSGAVWGERTDVIGSGIGPRQFGVLQDIQIDFDWTDKELYGQLQFPLAIARGQGKISGKAKFAQILGLLYSDIFFGTPAVTGIILGTTTVQKALSNLAQSIVAEFVNSAVKSVFGEIGKLLGASLAGGGGSSGDQDFWGGITGAGEDIEGGGISAGPFNSGGLLGTLGLGSLVSGGGIFGGLFKGIGSLFGFEHGGIVPSAQGGWMVPSTSLAMLHANEMVLPPNISQGLQSMIAGGGAGAGSSDPGANVMFNVSAIDSQSVAKFLQSNGNVLVAAINRAMRNGAAPRSA